jgi:hypothetical protein
MRVSLLDICTCIHIMFLLTASVRLLRLLYAILILDNRPILVFWALFGYLLRPILNYFENNLVRFLGF